MRQKGFKAKQGAMIPNENHAMLCPVSPQAIFEFESFRERTPGNAGCHRKEGDTRNRADEKVHVASDHTITDAESPCGY